MLMHYNACQVNAMMPLQHHHNVTSLWCCHNTTVLHLQHCRAPLVCGVGMPPSWQDGIMMLLQCCCYLTISQWWHYGASMCRGINRPPVWSADFVLLGMTVCVHVFIAASGTHEDTDTRACASVHILYFCTYEVETQIRISHFWPQCTPFGHALGPKMLWPNLYLHSLVPKYKMHALALVLMHAVFSTNSHCRDFLLGPAKICVPFLGIKYFQDISSKMITEATSSTA